MQHTILMRFPGGRPKALTLSYDDGVEQDIKLIEILDKHGLKCTFNLNSGRFAPEGTVYEKGTVHRPMTEAKVTEVYKNSGHEVAVHGYNHPLVDSLPSSAVVLDVIKDRENLEKQFDRIIRGMAYPYGAFSDEVVAALRACGIVYSRTVKATLKFDIPTDWLRMPATCHHNDARLMELAKKFVESKNKRPQLFYLWGHSYEFEERDNWNVIEEFAEYMGGRDDIWYATNIEIYDYISAYEKLIFSADAHKVYNPTAKTLYFAVGKNADGGVIEIKPDETLCI